MTESWRQMMDLGIVHFMAYPAIKDDTPESVLESVRALGQDDFFDVIEVKRSQQEGLYPQLKAVCDQSGLAIGVGAQPGLLGKKLSLNTLDEAGRKAAIDEVKLAIDAAYELGAKICACLSGPGPSDPADVAPMMDAMVDSCVQLCRYSQEKATGEPVWLSVEQFDHAVDKKCLIGPSDRSAEFAARVRKQVSNFGLTVDLSHVPILHEDVRDLVTTLAPYTIHLHAGNAVAQEGLPGYGDYHPRFDYPGGSNGVAELKGYLEALIYAGVFQNEVPTEKMVFTFEVKPMPGETSELILAHTKRTFLQAWAEL